MARVFRPKNRLHQLVRRVNFMATSRAADILQSFLEFYLPRKNAIKLAARDSIWGLISGLLVGWLIGIIVLFG